MLKPVAPTSQPSTDRVVFQGLIPSLVKPYWDETAAGWKSFFRTQFFRGPFDVDGRDESVAALGRAVRNFPGRTELRLLILEHIGQNGMYGTYERTVLAALPESVPDDFTRLGVTAVEGPRWGPVQRYAEELFRFRGRSISGRHLFDATDALVLTYFDGRAWRSETWFCMSSPDFVGDPQKPSDLPPDMLAYARLLCYVNKDLGERVSFRAEAMFPDFLIRDEK